MQKSYVLYQLSFLRRGQKKCPLFFKPSIVLSILNIVKHRLHVWVAVTRLLVLGRARTSFSSASSEPFLAAMDRKNSSQAADGEDQVNNEDTSRQLETCDGYDFYPDYLSMMKMSFLSISKPFGPSPQGRRQPEVL